LKTIRGYLRSRGALLAVVVAILGGALGLLAPANVAQSATCVRRPHVVTYYSDASHTTVVGQQGDNCTCDGVDWGVTSPYQTIFYYCCSIHLC